MPSEEMEAIVAAESGVSSEEAARIIEEVVCHRPPELRGLIVYYIPVGLLPPARVKKFILGALAEITTPVSGQGPNLLDSLKKVGYELLVMPMRPDGTALSTNPRVEQISYEIDHLSEGVDSSSLHDLDDAMAGAPAGTPPQQFQDAAQDILTRAADGSKQLAIAEVIALAELLFKLYNFFRDHLAARLLLKRAATHPHGLAAQLVHRKVNDKLPVQLKDVPKVAAGVTELTNVALERAGV